MQGRSWMAAAGLFAACTAAAALLAPTPAARVAARQAPAAPKPDAEPAPDPGPKPEARKGKGDEAAWITNWVELDLHIAGLGREGCEVEIKPATPSCKFPAITRHLDPQSNGNAKLVLKPPLKVSTASADRDCTFAITIKEPGQPPRTVRRGLRLASASPDGKIPLKRLTCFLSTPSLASSKAAEAGATRVK